MPAEEEAGGASLARSGPEGDPPDGNERQRRHALLAELYADLHRRANGLMRHQRPDHTLQATALVNEACLRLLHSEELDVSRRDEVLALAATAMRCVLVDHARARARSKRKPPGPRVALDDLLGSYEHDGLDMVALDEALHRLAEFDPEMARAIELRYFAGLPVDETARLLGLSRRVFERHWTAARAWLRAELE